MARCCILTYRAGAAAEDQEALGQDLHCLLAPKNYHDLFKKAFPEFIHSGQGNAVGKTVELKALRKDQIEIDISLSLSAVLLNGEWHAVGIMRDITKQKKAEEALREAKEEAGLEVSEVQRYLQKLNCLYSNDLCQWHFLSIAIFR